MKSELQKWQEKEYKKEINANIKHLQLKGVYLSRKEIVRTLSFTLIVQEEKLRKFRESQGELKNADYPLEIIDKSSSYGNRSSSMMVRSTLSPSPSRQVNLSEKRLVEKEQFVRVALELTFCVGEGNEEL